MGVFSFDKQEFDLESKRTYFLTLVDVYFGASIAELMSELKIVEEQEHYSFCEGLMKGIRFCEKNNYIESKKERLRLSNELFKDTE